MDYSQLSENNIFPKEFCFLQYLSLTSCHTDMFEPCKIILGLITAKSLPTSDRKYILSNSIFTVQLIAGSGNKILDDTNKAKLAPFIVGGDDTDSGDWPSHVMIYSLVGNVASSCGGVLISPRYVLTSAACVNELV